jgi:hypothetical protein
LNKLLTHKKVPIKIKFDGGWGDIGVNFRPEVIPKPQKIELIIEPELEEASPELLNIAVDMLKELDEPNLNKE